MMLDIITKILGYYTLYFVIKRFYNSMKKLEPIEIDAGAILAKLLIYMPAIAFVVIQLCKMGLRL